MLILGLDLGLGWHPDPIHSFFGCWMSAVMSGLWRFSLTSSKRFKKVRHWPITTAKTRRTPFTRTPSSATFTGAATTACPRSTSVRRAQPGTTRRAAAIGSTTWTAAATEPLRPRARSQRPRPPRSPRSLSCLPSSPPSLTSTALLFSQPLQVRSNSTVVCPSEWLTDYPRSL